MKFSFILIAAWIAVTANSPACIYCMMQAQQGLSPGDPSGQLYDSPPAHWICITNNPARNITSTAAVSNAMVELPKTNLPTTATYTNGALIGFDVLAGYNISLMPEWENSTNATWADAQVNGMIPENIRALDHREVSVDGFMIPVKMENDKVTEFLLSRNPPACCYGGTPLIHEWIVVNVKPPGVAFEEYNTVRAYGTLSIGATRSGGTLTSIYRMEANKVETTPSH